MKRRAAGVTVLTFVIILTSCPIQPSDVSVTRILLNKNNINIVLGYPEQLHAFVFPANAANKNVIWDTIE